MRVASTIIVLLVSLCVSHGDATESKFVFTDRFVYFPELDSSNSLEVPSYLVDYVAETLDRDKAGDRVAMFVIATDRAKNEYGAKIPDTTEVVARLVTIAKHESDFRTDVVNPSGHTGQLQLSPSHEVSMNELGLNFDKEADRLVYGCLMYTWRGYGPWVQVKADAIRDYNRVMKP